MVKLTHWGVVAAVIANAFFTEEGAGAHIWVGYGLAVLLLLRLVWGVVGPRQARFAAFPPSIGKAMAHIREIRAGKRSDHASHNPLGALMVYAIWACLGVIVASGIAMAGLPTTSRPGDGGELRIEQAYYPSYADDDEVSGHDGESYGRNEHEEGVTAEIHESAVNLLYVLILLHIGGVLFETRRSGRDIALAMLPGRR